MSLLWLERIWVWCGWVSVAAERYVECEGGGGAARWGGFGVLWEFSDGGSKVQGRGLRWGVGGVVQPPGFSCCLVVCVEEHINIKERWLSPMVWWKMGVWGAAGGAPFGEGGLWGGVGWGGSGGVAGAFLVLVAGWLC